MEFMQTTNQIMLQTDFFVCVIKDHSFKLTSPYKYPENNFNSWNRSGTHQMLTRQSPVWPPGSVQWKGLSSEQLLSEQSDKSQEISTEGIHSSPGHRPTGKMSWNRIWEVWKRVIYLRIELLMLHLMEPTGQ